MVRPYSYIMGMFIISINDAMVFIGVHQDEGCYVVLVQNQDETYTLRTSHNHPANETMLQEIEIK